ncbi:carbohydrate esterase family 8 protein [Athelia psychrophila]|uniref:pectinesterase n=1 Tax=Athelia psychrophila TaxID=1759441 RepID=A0A166QYX6_9AGAM|nr:carbohydrate esterase family 8 protein [Fibularhizoctonia sp. CBS 109695]
MLVLASLLSLLLVPSTLAANAVYSQCQYPKPQGSQLDGCPNGTFYVSQTDPQAGYGTISAALAALPDDISTQTILVGPGSYHEVVNVTRGGPLTLLGITSKPNSYTSNTVYLWNSSYINQTTMTASQDNADAVVLTISPNRDASLVGSGPTGAPLQSQFGNTDFKMYNIDVANRATVNGMEYKAGDTGPSAALFVSYANASFYECTFASYQDTLYVGRNGSAVFVGGEVTGSTDFIYGFGTAYFEGTTLASRGAGGGLVAWKGSTQWYGPNTFGAYFSNSKIIKSSDALPSLDLTGERALARPWNNQSRVVYMNAYMSDIVLPQGFIKWSASDPRVFPNVTFFVESGSYGPGWNASARNYSIESVISKTEAEATYSLSDVFGGLPSWVDGDYGYN